MADGIARVQLCGLLLLWQKWQIMNALRTVSHETRRGGQSELKLFLVEASTLIDHHAVGDSNDLESLITDNKVYRREPLGSRIGIMAGLGPAILAQSDEYAFFK